MIDNIVIRNVKKGDVKELVKGFKKAYLPLFKAQELSQSTIDEMFLLNDEDHLLKRFKGNYFFVAEDTKNKKIAGLIGLRKDKGLYVHNRISTLFLLKEYRGKGIGSMLFNKVLDLAESFNVEKMVVNSSIQAGDIYSHWGFKRVRVNIKKYSNGDKYKNVWMEKKL